MIKLRFVIFIQCFDMKLGPLLILFAYMVRVAKLSNWVKRNLRKTAGLSVRRILRRLRIVEILEHEH